MKFNVREFNKDKSQQQMDKLFKELYGFANPYEFKVIKDKYKKNNKKKR